MDNFQEHPVADEKEEMKAEIRELNQDLDLHDIIVSTYKSEIAQLKSEVSFLKELLKVAHCPNFQCQSGVICHPDGSEGGYFQEECQWCYMTSKALKDAGIVGPA